MEEEVSENYVLKAFLQRMLTTKNETMGKGSL